MNKIKVWLDDERDPQNSFIQNANRYWENLGM